MRKPSDLFRPLPRYTRPATIGLTFGLLGVLWIIFSDTLLNLLVTDLSLYSTLQTGKDSLFILLSAFAIGAVLSRLQTGIRSGEARLRAVLDNSFDGIGVFHNGVCVMANRSLGQMFGYDDPAQLVGRNGFELVAPQERGRVLRNFRRRMRDEPARSRYDSRGLHRDGSEFAINLSAGLFSIDGRQHVVMVVSDISEQERNSLRTERERDYFAGIVEALDDAVIGCDDEGRLSCFNRAARELFELPAEAEPGDALPADTPAYLGLREAGHPRPLDTAAHPLERLRAGHPPPDTLLQPAAGARRDAHLRGTGSVIEDGEGQPLGAWLMLREMDTQLELAAQHRAEQLARTSLSDLGQILAGTHSPAAMARKALPPLCALAPDTPWVGISLLDTGRSEGTLIAWQPGPGEPETTGFSILGMDMADLDDGIRVYAGDRLGPLERPAPVRMQLDRMGIGDYIHVPLTDAGRILGALNIAWGGEKAPSATTLEYLQTAGTLLASGLARALDATAPDARLDALEEQAARQARHTARLQSTLREVENTLRDSLHPPLRAVRGFSDLLQERYEDILATDARRHLGQVIRAGEQLDQRVDELQQLLALEHRALHPARVDIAPLIAGADLPAPPRITLPPVQVDAELLGETLTRLNRGLREMAPAQAVRLHCEQRAGYLEVALTCDTPPPGHSAEPATVPGLGFARRALSAMGGELLTTQDDSLHITLRLPLA